ncbi:hypothetical protein [Listeria booriae]|nr:hypothetical protein [Listeria booriae]
MREVKRSVCEAEPEVRQTPRMRALVADLRQVCPKPFIFDKVGRN